MSACKHRVMDNCIKYRHPCTFSEECFEPQEDAILTNVDCVRAMSDEGVES